MSARLMFEREGTRLSCVDFGGSGDPVVLLHGLAGHAEEWAETASWLTETHRVVAFDARGHGYSERSPEDVSRSAHVADTAFVVEQLDLGPVALAGQSLGGHAAILVAAVHPDLVSSLVVLEASPESGSAAEVAEHVAAVRESLESWPVPFTSRSAALEFWGAASVKAEAWVSGLAEADDGLRPRFEIGVMASTLDQALDRSYWSEWEGLSMPALLVRGSNGVMSHGDAAVMVARGMRAELVEIPGAGHDLHLERPDEWRRALTNFLDRRRAAK